MVSEAQTTQFLVMTAISRDPYKTISSEAENDSYTTQHFAPLLGVKEQTRVP